MTVLYIVPLRLDCTLQRYWIMAAILSSMQLLSFSTEKKNTDLYYIIIRGGSRARGREYRTHPPTQAQQLPPCTSGLLFVQRMQKMHKVI